MQTLGDRIQNIRLNKGMNKTEFGKLFDATGSLVNKWENHGVNPSEDRVKKIAKMSGYTVDELLYGNLDTQTSVDDELIKNLKDYLKVKRDFFKQEVKLLTPALKSVIFTLGLGYKEEQEQAIDDRIRHDKRIKELEKFGYKYVIQNYDNYTYDRYLKDFPNSGPQEFNEYKEHEWSVFKETLDKFWSSLDFIEQNYSWINKRFTDQIADELDELSKLATKEGKEHYYVNEVVQPFLDKTAKDFKEYIKDNTDIE